MNFRDIKEPKVVAFGNHASIIQSMLDFDFMVGRKEPSVKAVVGVRQKVCRYFFGEKEILIKGYSELDEVPRTLRGQINLIAVMQSARRALACIEQSVAQLPKAKVGFVFAENVTETDAIKLRDVAKKGKMILMGPASVGVLVGGGYKLGPIGGITATQIKQSKALAPGDTVVLSTSGGIVNEVINLVTNGGGSLAYAATVGGDLFPVTKPFEIFEMALNDPQVKTIVYFGELGGHDEEQVARIYKESKSKKPAVAYVAGSIGEHFDTPQQFGHAKAMASRESETTSFKRRILREAGLKVADGFAEFEELINKHITKPKSKPAIIKEIKEPRMSALFVDNISSEGDDGVVRILGEDIVKFTSDRSLSEVALQMFLGKKKASPNLLKFFDTGVKLLVDHGPQVSGAVNTMVTARAGMDLPAALASGILTVGPRFGGAIDQAAKNWFLAVNDKEEAYGFVERFAKSKVYVPGIGHRKYRIDNPDPRVQLLLKEFDKGGKYTDFAKSVAKITSSKKANLILNVDGTMAALLLDILSKDEKMTDAQIEEVLESGFCNAMFVFARSVGFIAHYLEQKRLDEGLFRLPNGMVISDEN
jgi:ATP-citrate lyase alpha-subunit